MGGAQPGGWGADGTRLALDSLFPRFYLSCHYVSSAVFNDASVVCVSAGRFRLHRWGGWGGVGAEPMSQIRNNEWSTAVMFQQIAELDEWTHGRKQSETTSPRLPTQFTQTPHPVHPDSPPSLPTLPTHPNPPPGRFQPDPRLYVTEPGQLPFIAHALQDETGQLSRSLSALAQRLGRMA